MKLFSKSEILQKSLDFLKKHPNGVLEIVGPTASGKTDFTVKLAKSIENESEKKSEIIVVDSRQIYRECNISSAKITEDEMEGIPHWGIDLKNPDEHFSVYEFQQYAFGKIEEIHSQGNIPILSGGTMLWLDAISENYVFTKNPVDKNNAEDETLSRINLEGKQYEKSPEKGVSKYPFLKIGLFHEREILYERINTRAKIQFENGLIEETKEIIDKYDLSPNTYTSFGYLEIKDFLDENISYQRALEINQQRNRNYAKRQLTWWRGREDVLWIKNVA